MQPSCSLEDCNTAIHDNIKAKYLNLLAAVLKNPYTLDYMKMDDFNKTIVHRMKQMIVLADFPCLERSQLEILIFSSRISFVHG